MSLHAEGPFIVKKRVDPKDGERVDNCYVIVDAEGNETTRLMFDLKRYILRKDMN